VTILKVYFWFVYYLFQQGRSTLKKPTFLVFSEYLFDNFPNDFAASGA